MQQQQYTSDADMMFKASEFLHGEIQPSLKLEVKQHQLVK